MPKPKTKNQKPKTKPSVVGAKTRQIHAPNYKSFRLSRRLKQPKAPLPGSFKLFRSSMRVLLKSWRLYGGIALVYLLLTVVLVKGFGVSGEIGELKTALQETFGGEIAQVTTSFALFSVLLSNANSTASEAAGAYQSILLIVVSLVLIWALRQTQASGKPGIREAFYKGLYPLVPFLLVLIVIGLQLVPLLIASFLYSAVFDSGLAVTPIEQGLWALLLFVLTLLSLYMVTSSVFALYIATLPDMTPMTALRSARDLVRHRRWTIMRKLVFLPLALLVIAAVIMVPLIIVSPTLAEWLFFILSMLSLAAVHSYLYGLYRELLKR